MTRASETNDRVQIDLRDIFAAVALLGMYLPQQRWRDEVGWVGTEERPFTSEMRAMLSYSQADAMMKARGK